MKVAMFLVPVIIAAVFGLAMAGVIDIPGLSPKKKPAAAKKETPKEVPKPKPVVKAPEVKAEATPTNPDKGFEAVAKLWNEMDGKKLVEQAALWKDDELGPILRKMEPDRVVEFLGALEPERAAKLTKLLQKLAESEAG